MNELKNSGRHRVSSDSLPRATPRAKMRGLWLSGAVALLGIGALLAVCGFAKSGPAPADSTKAGSTSATMTELPEIRLFRDLQTPGPVSAIGWSSDGRLIAAPSLAQAPRVFGAPYVPSPFGGLITIWSADGSVVQELHRPRPFFSVGDNFAFAAGDKQIVTPPSIDSNDLAFSVFDIVTGQIVHEAPGLHPGRLRNVNGAITLKASPDESLVAVIFGRALPQPVALYRTSDWSKLADVGEAPRTSVERPTAAAFSRDGKRLAVGKVDGTITVYDTKSMGEIEKIEALPRAAVEQIAFNVDGTLIVVCSAAGEGFRPRSGGMPESFPLLYPVSVFRIEDGARLSGFPATGARVNDVAWDSTGRFIGLITNYRDLHIWDVSVTDRVVERTVNHAEADSLAFAFSPSGGRLAVGARNDLRIFDIIR